jgi:hypothetical protein
MNWGYICLFEVSGDSKSHGYSVICLQGWPVFWCGALSSAYGILVGVGNSLKSVFGCCIYYIYIKYIIFM